MFFNYIKINNPAIFGLIYSGGLLIIALAFQYFEKLIPCQMCLWQRWPHIAIIILCILLIISQKYLKIFLLLLILLAFASAATGFWHSGVELGIFNSPGSCSSLSSNTIVTLQELLDKPVVGCDIIVWSFLGLSMTNWNTLLSLIETFVLIYLSFIKKIKY